MSSVNTCLTTRLSGRFPETDSNWVSHWQSGGKGWMGEWWWDKRERVGWIRKYTDGATSELMDETELVFHFQNP